MKFNFKIQKKNIKNQFGRISPFVLGLVILITGIWLDKGWLWQIGLTVITVVIIEVIYHYRALN